MFKQKQIDGIPISRPIPCEKAIQLSKKLFGKSYQFIVSEGWKWRFCDRHGIRSISSQGKKLAADTDAAVEFVPRLSNQGIFLLTKSLTRAQFLTATREDTCRFL